jgi:hypothetical protein
MINEFGKKGYKQIEKLMEKLEKRKETLERQEDLLILEKERNLVWQNRSNYSGSSAVLIAVQPQSA